MQSQLMESCISLFLLERDWRKKVKAVHNSLVLPKETSMKGPKISLDLVLLKGVFDDHEMG
jgi:hypothetical protein